MAALVWQTLDSAPHVSLLKMIKPPQQPIFHWLDLFLSKACCLISSECFILLFIQLVATPEGHDLLTVIPFWTLSVHFFLSKVNQIMPKSYTMVQYCFSFILLILFLLLYYESKSCHTQVPFVFLSNCSTKHRYIYTLMIPSRYHQLAIKERTLRY